MRIGWVAGQGPACAAGAEPPSVVEAVWQDLLRQAADARHEGADEARRTLEDAGVTLGPWQAIGPFQEAAFGIARRCFDTPFAPAQDVLHAGLEPVDLTRDRVGGGGRLSLLSRAGLEEHLTEPAGPGRPGAHVHGFRHAKYCVKCHSGPTPDAAIDLSGDRTRFFSMAYDNLIERGLVDWFSAFAQGVDENTPKMHGALVSRLRQYMETDQHYGAQGPAEGRQRIYTWIDANVPYYGTYTYNGMEYTARGGVPRYHDGTLIGTGVGLSELVKRFIGFTGCSLLDAIRTVTEIPAKVLGLYPAKGTIREGCDADLAIIDDAVEVCAIVVGGPFAYERP